MTKSVNGKKVEVSEPKAVTQFYGLPAGSDDQAREPIIDDSKRFNREKRELRMLYKQWKAGMLRREDISPKMMRLLRRYYGVQ